MRFKLEKTEAASTFEAAFLLHDTKGNVTVRVLHFRTLRQLDAYQSDQKVWQVRNFPILLEGEASEGLFKRMTDWYYYTILNPDDETRKKLEQNDQL